MTKAAGFEQFWTAASAVGPRDTPAGAGEGRLVARLRAGELDAIEALYDAFRVPVFGFLMRLARDRHVAEDLFQNTWVKITKSARRLREDTDLRAWIFTVARNEYRSHRRWELLDVSQLLALGETGERLVEPSGSSEERVDHEAIERALAALGDGDREVLLLIGVEGMCAQQAASVLRVSYGALRQRLARARGRLRARLLELDESKGKPARET